MVQPLVGISYKLIENAFIDWGISQQFLKLGVFCILPYSCSYLMAVFYEKSAVGKFESRIPQNSKRCRLVLNPKVNE